MVYKPLVTAIIPAHNAAGFIGQALESVQSQTYENIEAIVVDDGSRDETAEITASFAAADARFRLLRQENQGVAAARNLAIANARGELIAPLDADDIWYPTKIEKQVDCFRRSGPSVGLVYNWCTSLDESGAIIGTTGRKYAEGDVFEALVFSNFLGNGSVPLIRRSCFDAVGLYDPTLRARGGQGCEDWELYLRIAERYRFGLVPDYLVGYRRVSNSMSMDSAGLIRSYELMIGDLKQRHPSLARRLIRWSRSYIYLSYSGTCYERGNYRGALSLALKAMSLDPTTLLSPFLMKLVAKSLIKPALGRNGAAAGGNGSGNGQAGRGRTAGRSKTLARVLAEVARAGVPGEPLCSRWNVYGRIRNRRWNTFLSRTT